MFCLKTNSKCTIFFITFTLILSVKTVSCLRLCKEMSDYIVPTGGNCWDEPIEKMNMTEFAKSLGLNTEEHYVTTKDGYVLFALRLYQNITRNSAVLFGHGAFGNSFIFLIKGKQSIAYMLAQDGYDVWLFNFRGVRYSMKHKTLSSNELKYWNFSFQEYGDYDVPAVLDLVVETSKKKVILLGYSQGTTVFMTYAATHPEDASEKIRAGVMVGVVLYFLDTGNLRFIVPLEPLVKPFVDTLFHGDILAFKPLYDRIIPHVASSILVTAGNSFLTQFLSGYDFAESDPAIWPIFVTQAFPDHYPMKNYEYYAQLIDKEKFTYFDYGKEKNLELYKSEEPPEYPLHNITIPIVFYQGDNDQVSTLRGSNTTYSKLSKQAQCAYNVVSEKKWNHFDHMLAKNASEVVFKPILEKMRILDTGNCDEVTKPTAKPSSFMDTLRSIFKVKFR